MYAADDLILVTFVVDYITKMIDVCVFEATNEIGMA